MMIRPAYPPLTASDFLGFDFGDRKAELDGGVIRMMAGGTARHVAVAGNILLSLASRLRGSGMQPYSSDMAVQTHASSVRHPDISVFRDRRGVDVDHLRALDDPVMLVELMRAGIARSDLIVKLDEYRALSSVDTILFVDIATERVRVIQRTGPHGWADVAHDQPVDVPLPALNVTLPHDEMFARD